jgi:hypothetical protein
MMRQLSPNAAAARAENPFSWDLNMIWSTPMAATVVTVSRAVSPFCIDEVSKLGLIIRQFKFKAANSKDRRVRVLLSKNKSATLSPFSEISGSFAEIICSIPDFPRERMSSI